MANARRSTSSDTRAWNMLRLAILWPRKGSFIKRKLLMDVLHLKALKRNNSKLDPIGYYGEHQLSFDKTPIMRVKMYKPTSMKFRIPCFTPGIDDVVDFNDWDDDDHHNDYCFNNRNCVLHLEDPVLGEEDTGEDQNDDGDEMIDERADKFIAEFYAQMRLQRQISRLEYQL